MADACRMRWHLGHKTESGCSAYTSSVLNWGGILLAMLSRVRCRRKRMLGRTKWQGGLGVFTQQRGHSDGGVARSLGRGGQTERGEECLVSGERGRARG